MRALFTCALLIAGLLISASPAQAQAFRGWGFEVGLSSANQKWSDINFRGITNPRWDAHEAFTAGVFAEFLDMDRLSAVAGVSYVQYGIEANRVFPQFSERSSFYDGRALRYQAQLDYVSVSLQGKVRLWQNEQTRLNPYVMAGPVLSFYVREKGTTRFEHDEGHIKMYPSVFNQKNIWGLRGGLGTEVPVPGPATVLLEADYTIGLVNTLRVGEARDRVLAVTVGVRY